MSSMCRLSCRRSETALPDGQILNVDARFPTHARRLGGRVIAKELRHRLLSRTPSFGLRCDLGNLPPLKEAAVPLTLEPCLGAFDGFTAELGRTTGADYGRALRREHLHQRGVRTLYVARNQESEPVYVQWLVAGTDRATLDAAGIDFWPPFPPNEVLLEFAYTFTPFRGMGAMGDGMGRLLRVAADQGATAAHTYVTFDNVPSLRGCAKVGFTLDHVREVRMLGGFRRGAVRSPTPAERTVWEVATAPRS
jgi:RimJ/RimL family protein N-acetyltransferase